MLTWDLYEHNPNTVSCFVLAFHLLIFLKYQGTRHIRLKGNERISVREGAEVDIVKVGNIEIGAGIPKVCVPIVGKTQEEILSAAREIVKTTANLVEWRVDWFEGIFDFNKKFSTRLSIALLKMVVK